MGNTYIKCPRCELNYILKKDKYCDVCKSEMRAGILDENDYDDYEEGIELCPICKVNYLNEGETMCSTCQEEQTSPRDDEPDWRGFVDSTDDSDEELDLLPVEEDIDEELEGAFAKDLEGEFGDEEFDDEENLDDEEFDDDFGDSFDDDLDDDIDDDDEDDEDDDEDDDLLF